MRAIGEIIVFIAAAPLQMWRNVTIKFKALSMPTHKKLMTSRKKIIVYVKNC